MRQPTSNAARTLVQPSKNSPASCPSAPPCVSISPHCDSFHNRATVANRPPPRALFGRRHPKSNVIMEAILELLRRNGIEAKGLQVENPAKKSKVFANFMAGLWFFYAVGAWYGSKFLLQDSISRNWRPTSFRRYVHRMVCRFFWPRLVRPCTTTH